VNPVLNIAGYRFTALEDLPALRAALDAAARRLSLTGTIILAPEGINLMLAGAPGEVERMIEAVRRCTGVAELPLRRSWSAQPPFKRMRIRTKAEIVALKRPDLRPDRAAAPRIDAPQLNQWLDEGRDILLLDTRNRFEVEMGTFRGAHHLNLRSFSDLPAAAAAAELQHEHRTIVTFCTGGIRCEKAALLMMELGAPRVVQLDGGILGWFSACGSRHFEGDCFVFDERSGVDAALAPIAPAGA